MNVRKYIKIYMLKTTMLAGLLCPAHAMQAQSESVRFENRDMTVEEALSTIERQTPYTFVINHAYFDVTRRVALSSTSMTVNQAIAQLVANTGNKYEFRDKHIIIKRATSQPPVANRQERREPLAIVQKEPANETVRAKVERPTPAPVANSPLSHREFAPGQEMLPRFEIKTNLLQAAATTPHLGFEIGLDNRISLEMSGSYNPWRLNTMDENNKKRVYWIALAEARYWSCERFNGHFFGAHAFYGKYNISNHDVPLLFKKQYRYEGNALGAGISYGYNLMIDRRWSVELIAGIGLARMEYKRYSCKLCDGDHVAYKKLYLGPTRAGITLAYIIK